MQLKSRKTSIRSSRRNLERELSAAADPRRAEFLQGYFKTGEGQYGEGDRILGISVPMQRKIALRYPTLSFDDLSRLLASAIHEHRFAALEILVAQFEIADAPLREEIVSFYLQHTHRMNNWDLVDTAAPYILGEYLKGHIVGEYLKERPRDLLDALAASSNLWERRIAIVSTLSLIRHGETKDTFRIARKLLSDEHDLIHKAVGWALRETGKVAPTALLSFLRKHHASMPRTTLRYAIEHFPAAERKQILNGIFDGIAEGEANRKKLTAKKVERRGTLKL